MLEKIGGLSQQVVTSASRRKLLGRFGRGAMTLAAVVGGALAFPRHAWAAPRKCGGQICPPGYNYCCSYLDHGGGKRVHYCSLSRCQN